MKSLTKTNSKRIVYVPGLNSTIDYNTSKIKLLKKHGEVEILDVKGDFSDDGYRSAHANLKYIPDFYVGTSRGGYWAIKFGNEQATPWVALNPSLHNGDIEFTGGLLIVALYDDLLGTKHQREVLNKSYGNCDIVEVQTTDHRLSSTTPYAKHLGEFLDGLHIWL